MTGAFTFLSFEIGTENDRQIDGDELGFSRTALASLGCPDLELRNSVSKSIPVRNRFEPAPDFNEQLVSPIRDALSDTGVVVVRLNFHGVSGHSRVEAAAGAIEEVSRGLGSDQRLLVSVPFLPGRAQIRWAIGLMSGSLFVISDSGQSLPSADLHQGLDSLDLDRWRYEARHLFGSALDRFESKLTRLRGVFDVSDDHVVRFLYDATHATAELRSLLNDWIRGHAAAESNIHVYWVEARQRWLGPAIHGAAVDLAGFGVAMTQLKIADGTVAPEPPESAIQPGERAVVILPVVDKGVSADLVLGFLRDRNVDVIATYSVLTTATPPAAANARQGRITPVEGDLASDVEYLLRVPQEHRRRKVDSDTARLTVYSALEQHRAAGVNALDFWNFVLASGAILERVEEVPSDRSPRVVPAFARGMLNEGFWLVDAFVNLLQRTYETTAGADLLVFPEGDLASTMLRHGCIERIATDGTVPVGIECITIPRTVLSAVKKLDGGQTDEFVSSNRGQPWRQVLSRRWRKIIIVDEFRTRDAEGTLSVIDRLIDVLDVPDHEEGADGAAVLLDLFCEPQETRLQCASLYGWPSRQVKRGEYPVRVLPQDATDGLVHFLREVLANDAVGELTRILALDELSSLLPPHESGVLAEQFLPPSVQEIVTNTKPDDPVSHPPDGHAPAPSTPAVQGNSLGEGPRLLTRSPEPRGREKRGNEGK